MAYMNEEPEVINSTNDEQDNNEEQVDVAKLIETNKRLYARAKLAESKLKEKDEKLPEKADDSLKETVAQLALSEKKRQFGFQNNLSPEEVDFVFQMSGGNPSKETLDNPFVKAGIESYRSEKRASNNIPSPSRGGLTFQGKEFKDLTDDERRKAFEEKRKNFRLS